MRRLLAALGRWLAIGRRSHVLLCPGCGVRNVVVSRPGDRIVCGVCAEPFWHPACPAGLRDDDRACPYAGGACPVHRD